MNRRLAFWWAATLSPLASAGAQRQATAAIGVPAPALAPAPEVARPIRLVPDSQPSVRTRVRWWAPLASAALPGAGQAAFRQDRWLPYVAIEAFSWFQYAAARAEGRRESRAYRKLAADVAQSQFGTAREGDFDYYERMKHFSESGVYDLVPGAELDPEIDTVTSNGALWLLARRTFWADPDVAPERTSTQYISALEFYTQRAVRPEFRYSWRNAQFEHDIFRRTIDRSNDAFRQSVEYLGAVLANHVLSTVDAYVTLRLQRRPATTGAPREGLELSGSIPWPRRSGARPPPDTKR